jgi:hypothetical protein
MYRCPYHMYVKSRNKFILVSQASELVKIYRCEVSPRHSNKPDSCLVSGCGSDLILSLKEDTLSGFTSCSMVPEIEGSCPAKIEFRIKITGSTFLNLS